MNATIGSTIDEYKADVSDPTPAAMETATVSV
jgi:hypothetical protein